MRVSIVTVIFYFSASYALRIQSFKEVGECNYWNDPHLQPFPREPGAALEQFLCRPNCTEVLLSNRFIEIFVASDPTMGEYPIVEYTVIFFPTDTHPAACVIRDSIANPSPVSSLTCPSDSPATTTGHYIHESDEVRVEIELIKKWFNFRITQSFELIGQSKGVCINSTCDPEYPVHHRGKRQDKKSNPIISQIIDIYVAAAREHVDGEIDEKFLESQRIAIEYDLNTSLNPSYARTIVSAILRESIKKDANIVNFNEQLVKIAEIEKKVTSEADQKVNKLIESSERFCTDNKEQQRCLEPINNDENKERAKSRRRK